MEGRRAPPPTTARPPGTRRTRPHWLPGYALLALGITSVFTGAFLVVGLAGVLAVFAPWILLAGGTGMLAGAVVAHRVPVRSIRSARGVGTPRPTAPRPGVRSAPVPSPGGYRPALDDRPAARAEAVRPPPPPSATPASRAAAPPPAGPGDRLWEAWIPAEGELPVELVGPIPSTAWVPPSEGAVDPFAEKAPSTFVLEGPASALWRAPPIEDVPGPDADSLVSTVGWAAAEFPPGSIAQEALTATPPHLRAPRVAAAPSREAPKSGAAVNPPEPGPCASCEKVPVVPAWSRPCPECNRPLCASCVIDALLDHGKGYCTACAPAAGLDGLAPPLDGPLPPMTVPAPAPPTEPVRSPPSGRSPAGPAPPRKHVRSRIRATSPAPVLGPPAPTTRGPRTHRARPVHRHPTAASTTRSAESAERPKRPA